MQRSKTIIFGSLILFFLAGCQAKVEKAKEPESIPVKVSKVELRELSEVLEYTGNIKAQDEALVYPKVSGKVVEKVKAEGELVAKGETIAFIDRDEVGLKFQKAPVESPLQGVLGKVYVDIGQNVTSATPAALVVSMDKVKISLDIPEKYLPKISLGQEAEVSVDAYPEQKTIAAVTLISPVVDPASRSASIEITADNPQHLLKSGMFARVGLIVAKHQDVACVLKEAVLGKEPGFYAYVIENNKAFSRNLRLGIRQGAYLEVKEGLRPGELVVIMGQQRLRDGAAVTMEIEEGQK